jgi:hypothetical protein
MNHNFSASVVNADYNHCFICGLTREEHNANVTEVIQRSASERILRATGIMRRARSVLADFARNELAVGKAKSTRLLIEEIDEWLLPF